MFVRVAKLGNVFKDFNYFLVYKNKARDKHFKSNKEVREFGFFLCQSRLLDLGF